MKHELPELIDINEVAALFRVTPNAIYRRIKRGTVPPPVTGRHEKRMWNRTDIEACLCGQWNAPPEIEETPARKKLRELADEMECQLLGI